MSDDLNLPKGWRCARLDELADTSSGGTPKSGTPAFYGGAIPWVKIGDLTDGAVEHTEQTITDEGIEASSAKMLPAGTLLVAMYGSIGKLGVLSVSAATNQAICAVQPHSELNPRYLFWYLRYQREALFAMGRGGTQRNIRQADVRALQVPVPPLAEQDRIVRRVEALLTEVGNGLEDLQRALNGLSQYRAACLAAAFDGAVRPLHELAFVQSGIAKGRPHGDALMQMPYIRTANVQALHLDLDEIKALHVTPDQRDKHLLRKDDVLVLEGGDADKVGRGWIWSGEVEDCLHQNHVFAVRPNRGLLLPRFLAYYVNAPQARKYFLSVAKQTVNLASINKSNLMALPVPVPTLDEQQVRVAMLDAQLSSTAELESGLRRRMEEAAVLRRSLLRAAFEGQLVSRDERDRAVADTQQQSRPRSSAGVKPVRKKSRAVLVGE